MSNAMCEPLIFWTHSIFSKTSLKFYKSEIHSCACFVYAWHCFVYAGTVLYMQALYYICRHCIVYAGTVLYLQALYCICRHCIVYAGTVFSVYRLFYMSWSRQTVPVYWECYWHDVETFNQFTCWNNGQCRCDQSLCVRQGRDV